MSIRDLLPCKVVSTFRDGDTVHTKEFQLLKVIGEGGMGTVYLALDLNKPQSVLDQPETLVALKYFHAKNLSADQVPGALERFRAEYALTREISHKNVVRFIDWYEDQEGNSFFVMEYVPEARSLYKLLEKQGGKGLPLSTVIRIGRQLLAGIEAIHQKDIVHRDLKPDNVLLTTDDHGEMRLLITDLGVAKDLQSEKRKTHTRALLGTPEYMAPEQTNNLPCRASDLWAFGVILYECYTGKLPFTSSYPAIFVDIMTEEPPALSTKMMNPDPAMERLIMACLRKEPKDRPNIAEILTMLREVEESYLRSLARKDQDTLIGEEPPAKPSSESPPAQKMEVSLKPQQAPSGLPRLALPIFVTLFALAIVGTFLVMRRDPESVAQAPHGVPAVVPTTADVPSAPTEPDVTPVDSEPGTPRQVPTTAVTAEWQPKNESEKKRYQNALALARGSNCRAGEGQLTRLFLKNDGTRDGLLASAECAVKRTRKKDADWALSCARMYLRLPNTSPADFSPKLRALYESSKK